MPVTRLSSSSNSSRHRGRPLTNNRISKNVSDDHLIQSDNVEEFLLSNEKTNSLENLSSLSSFNSSNFDNTISFMELDNKKLEQQMKLQMEKDRLKLQNNYSNSFSTRISVFPNINLSTVLSKSYYGDSLDFNNILYLAKYCLDYDTNKGEKFISSVDMNEIFIESYHNAEFYYPKTTLPTKLDSCFIWNYNDTDLRDVKLKHSLDTIKLNMLFIPKINCSFKTAYKALFNYLDHCATRLNDFTNLFHISSCIESDSDFKPFHNGLTNFASSVCKYIKYLFIYFPYLENDIFSNLSLKFSGDRLKLHTELENFIEEFYFRWCFGVLSNKIPPNSQGSAIVCSTFINKISNPEGNIKDKSKVISSLRTLFNTEFLITRNVYFNEVILAGILTLRKMRNDIISREQNKLLLDHIFEGLDNKSTTFYSYLPSSPSSSSSSSTILPDSSSSSSTTSLKITLPTKRSNSSNLPFNKKSTFDPVKRNNFVKSFFEKDFYDPKTKKIKNYCFKCKNFKHVASDCKTKNRRFYSWPTLQEVKKLDENFVTSNKTIIDNYTKFLEDKNKKPRQVSTVTSN